MKFWNKQGEVIRPCFLSPEIYFQLSALIKMQARPFYVLVLEYVCGGEDVESSIYRKIKLYSQFRDVGFQT